MNKINKYLKIKSKFKYYSFVILYYFVYIICFLLYGRKRNWLICERGNDAQDNGFVFFKYLIDFHKDIKPVYLIHKSSPDYSKVASLGKVVEYGSFKHFFMMIGYPTKISSHLFGYSSWINSTLYYRRHKTRHKHIFLQHGIIKNLHEGLFKEVCNSLDMFVCGAKPEYEFINREFNYNNNIPQYTGLPRYDMLDNYKCKNQILYMPTWRQSLSNVSDEEFLKSKFYLGWSNLINNQEINLLCSSKGIVIKFYLHYSLQHFSHLFKGNGIVRIVSFGEEVVQTLLKESLLLITDFSSVYFDFAYMKKPIIYYQFDEDTFFDEHYHKGYFDYRRDGFGDVCVSIEETIKSIERVFNNNFVMSDEYIDRTTSFFTLEKGHNCDRVFEAIKNI